MKCPKCNSENPEGAAYCNLCYFVFKKEEPGTPYQSAESVTQKAQQKEEPYREPNFFMQHKIISLLVITVVALISFNYIKKSLPVSKSIQINLDYVSIRYGDTFIRAKMEPEATEGFLVNNGFKERKSDGSFFVIPMEQARSLKAAYGDFTHCNSLGASAGQNSIQMLVLFSPDEQIREKIKKVIARSLNSPVIEIKGRKLDIAEYTIGGEKYSQFDLNTPENYYLIDDIRIAQEHYE